MHHIRFVFKGTTSGANTNSSAINIQCSFDGSTYHEMSDKLYPSQSATNTDRTASTYLILGGIKHIRLNMSDTETVNSSLFGCY